MVDTPLYKISLQKTFSFLKSGIWNSCGENPFSFFPTKVIEDLMSLAYSDTESMADIRLLLTSGRIQYLNLKRFSYEPQKELDVLLKMFSKDVCRNLRKLSVPERLTSDNLPLLEEMLRMCPNLEDVYSDILFDLNALKDCKEMRCLRFHVDKQESSNFTSQADFDALQSLNNLEIFAFCNSFYYCYVDPQAVAKVLLNCPNLISVGYVDSLTPLARILEAGNNPPPHFKLRMCLWGWGDWSIKNLYYLKEYKKLYPEYVKNAVSFYPLVEDLELLVFHKDCLQHLSNLQHLTYLCVDFNHIMDDNCIPELLSLLKKIGPQLRYLSVEMGDKVSICAICDLCPNLESLFIVNPSVIESDEPSLCLKHLKRLYCMKTNRETLMFLLTSCPDLSVLILSVAECLDDGLMASILKRNPLSQLKVVSITKCSLSTEGLRLLLLSVPSIEVMLMYRRYREVADLISELNLGTKQNLPTLDVSEFENFFYRKKYWSIL